MASLELQSDDQITPNPTWQEIEAAIRRMDGRQFTEVTLGTGPVAYPAYISIGGGDGRYWVFIWTEDEQNLTLFDPSKPDGTAALKSGGQSVHIPARQVVGLSEAVRAVRWYFEHSGADPGLKWQHD